MEKDRKDDLEAVRILVDTLNSFDDLEKERIIRWAREKLGLSLSIDSSAPILSSLPPRPTGLAELPSTLETPNKKRSGDIKSFIDEKDPKNDRQLAAVIAYYYAFEASESQRKISINSNDIVDACRLAQRHRPKRPVQTLINAAQSGFLDKSEETGHYKLNAVGENLVAMALPGETNGRRVIKRPISKKKTVKAKSKKNK